MKRIFFSLTLLAPLAIFLACDSANPVAPSGTVLTVTANPTSIGLSGSSSIRVSGFRPDGNPLNPGTQINVTTTLGTLVPDGVIEVGEDGVGLASLQGDGRTGTATVTASTPGGEAMATVDVLIGEDETTKPVLEITASPATIGLDDQSTITIFARAADGSPLGVGEVIELRTTLGTIRNQVATQNDGTATATLRSEDVPGTATVSARLDASDEVTVDVTIEERAPQLEIFANPDLIPVLGESQITVRARDSNGVPLGAGEEIELIANLGTVESPAVTNNNGVARATFTAGDQAGTGSVTAFLGNSESVSVSIQIRDAAASIDLLANPATIQRDPNGEEITLTARVFNAQGEPVAGLVVRFDSPLGSFNPATNGAVPTNNQGAAVETLTVTEQDVAGIPANGTFTVTATVTSEGNDLSDSFVITVQ